jgi:hypothetical protein
MFRLGLAPQVEYRARRLYHRAIFYFEPPHDGRADHAAVARDPDALFGQRKYRSRGHPIARYSRFRRSSRNMRRRDLALDRDPVSLNHSTHQIAKTCLMLPTKLHLGLGRIAEKNVDFGRAEMSTSVGRK